MLFLADRNILADQAFNAFSAFEETALVRISPDEIKKKGKVPKNGSIFFTIFQSFMSGLNDTPHFGEYPKDFFDFIIIDECHRGGANDESSWRDIMDYFSTAVQLGLTATPKRVINADTYNYFGDPVYTYSLKDGINDGFLTPYKIKEINTTIDDYVFTSDDTVLEGQIKEGKRYTEVEINRIIEILEREEMMEKIGEEHLRDFQDNEKSIPTILTTSQKLSTGVDVPEIRNIVLMRPINSIIEFKQILGRGTRLSENKDYFTIYDFVNAHHHFSDAEWDGEPLDPEPPGGVPPKPRPEPKPCEVCGQESCICEKLPPDTCEICGYEVCRCENKPPKIIKVKLADGKIWELQHMVKTSFWSPEGKPISADAFLQSLFGILPELFKDENELRDIWSKPDTRKKLLAELSEKGFAKAQLTELQRVLSAENSDLYDVLACVAFHAEIIGRSFRAEKAKVHLNDYNPKQQEFLNFVLGQYIKQGVEELDDSKIGDLLVLKYNAIADAKRELGDIPSIRKNFIDF